MTMTTRTTITNLNTIVSFKVFYSPPQTTSSNDALTPPTPSSVAILIHGTNGSLNTWNAVAPELVARLNNSNSTTTTFAVVTVDLPHHGHHDTYIPSPSSFEHHTTEKVVQALERDLTPFNFAKSLKHFLEHQFPSSVKKFHLFGQSHGGRTVLAFAELFPNMIASVAMGDMGIGPCPRPGRSREAMVYSACQSIEELMELSTTATLHHHQNDKEEEEEEAVECSVEKMTNTTNLRAKFATMEEAVAYIRRIFPEGDNPERKILHQQRQSGSGRSSCDYFEALVRPHVGLVYDFAWRKTDFRDTWEDLTVPTLVIRASEANSNFTDDEWSLMKELRMMASSSSSSSSRHLLRNKNRFVRVHDAAHGVHRSHPKEWVEVYADFLDKLA